MLVSLEAVLSDVRPFAYDKGDVTVDGVEHQGEAISFLSTESAGGSATGTTLIDLGPDAENVTVTVSVTAEHDADRTLEATQEISVDEGEIVWDRPAPDEYEEVGVSDDDSGVTVEAGGDGLHETDVSVTDQTPETDDAYRAGPMVRIENRTAIDDATVSIPIDETELDREGNLSMVTWDPHSEEPWTAVETEIDRDAGVATADVDHFSFFSLFWIDDWEDHTSDTITLEGDEVGDGVGNDSQIEKADFTFVIDVSGSMSGSPIQYAREAATRFVGGLTEDEQAGLVSFDSNANRVHELTRDHDALNASIESLRTGGGTHTEAGIRNGLDELEANGWENRSSVMILLADGRSSSYSDAESAAEDAADADVEISTVGLGNSIDENELREIAATTGGDFYHVHDAEDLPDTFDRVAQNQTGVQLPDTNGDGIPDLVAEMDLRMPTGEPGVVGQALDLHPTNLDTSGDGYLDNETVDINYRVYEENNETKLTAQVTHASSHPALADTTGDGLTDAEQLEGWEIEIVDDPYDAQDLEELVTDPDVNGDAASFFEPRTVYANPLVSDTSGDGIADVEERDRGTDPDQTDTTGDGISDADAFDDPEEDPTVFSTSPPAAELLAYNSWSELPSASWEPGWNKPEVEAPSWNFQYWFVLEDPAGIDSYELTRGSRTVGADDDVGGVMTITPTETLDSLREGAFTSWRGSQATVEATDIYGNSGGERIHSESSFYGEVIGTNVDPYAGGVLSGFTHSAAELPELIVMIGEALWDDPVESGGNFVDMVAGIDSDLLTELLPMIVESTRDQQDLDNPHPEDSSDYDVYAQGWYEGYALHFLASMAYGGTITKGATEGANVGTRLSRVSDELPTASRALRADGSGLKSAVIANRLADGGYDGLAAQFRTAGKEAAAVKRISEVDTAVLNRLSDSQRTDLVRVVGQYDDGATLVNRLGPDETQALLRSNANVDHVVKNYDGLPRHQQNRYANLLRDDDVGQSWLRVVSDETIHSGEVSRAIARTDEVSNFGRVTEFKTGRQVQRSEYPDEWAQVHKADSIATEYTLTEQTTFYRLYTEGTQQNPWGHFTLRSESDIAELSPSQLQGRYALPDELPNAVARGDIPEGTTMRTGEAARNDFGPGGGTQYTIPRSELPDEAPVEMWFGKSNSLTDALNN